MDGSESEITRLLKEWSAGGDTALERLMPLVFAHVRELAARAFAHEPTDHTLQPTALVSEVYLRLTGCRSVQWQNREQFFGFLAELMRRILVDYARRRKAKKRGGDMVKVPLSETEVSIPVDYDLLALHDALDQLAEIVPRRCRLVELKLFMGLTNEEIATVLMVSVKTVEREWRAARAWLQRELVGEGTDE